MNVSHMKWVDQHVGWLICICLDIFEFFRSFFVGSHRISPLKSPKRIVICKYFGMGSILMAEPLCRAIKSKYPDVSLEIVTFESNGKFCEVIGLFDRTITISTDGVFPFVFGVMNVLRDLRSSRVDVIFDLEFYSKFSTLISYFSRSDNRVGFYLRAMYRGNLLTHQVYYNHYEHISRIFLAFAEAIGIDVKNEPIKPVLEHPSEVINTTQIVRDRYGIYSDDSLVIVNPNASELAYERRWPLEKFTFVVKNILKTFPNVKVVLVGSKSDSSYVAEMYKQVKHENLHNTAGELSIEELMALINGSSLFIGNDSGPLHIAVALNVPTASFYGPETPCLYGPLGRQDEVFFAKLYCSPCMSAYNVKTANCAFNPAPCMIAIDENVVWKRISSFLSALDKGSIAVASLKSPHLGK